MKRNEYCDYLYWNFYRSNHIDFHAFMEIVKKHYGVYPIFDDVVTFKIDFHDTWYSEIDKYYKEDTNEEN